jgi:phage baseplate assembly protein W
LVWDATFTTSTHTSAVENAKQNLKNLLFTVKGERTEDDKYGVGLRTYLFENITTSTLEQIKNEISGQVRKYMPEIKITKLLVEQSTTNQNAIKVSISFTVFGADGAVEF